MKRQKPKIGDIFQIKLENQSYAYGQLLKYGIHAFYNYTSDGPADLEAIICSEPLFCIHVMDYALKRGVWKIIGNRPIPTALSGTFEFCRKDMVSGKFIISYYSDDGVYTEKPGSLDKCKQLEVTAVWYTEHAEDRLNDFYNGKEDRWAKAYSFK